jgi:hypothetical protein
MKKQIQIIFCAILALILLLNTTIAQAAPSYTIFGPSEIDLSACSPNGPTGTVAVPFWIMRDPAITGPTQIRFNNLPADVKVAFASQLNFNGIIAELLMTTFTVNAGINFPDQVIEIRVSDGANVITNQIILHGTCPRHNRDFTVRGSFHSSNHGVFFPVEGALVEIYRDVSWGIDQWVGSGITDSTGSFEIHLWADNEDTYYAKLRLNDVQGVYLHEAGDPSIKYYNSALRGNNSNPVIDVGATLISRDRGSGTPYSAVWQGGRAAYQEFSRTNGTPPPTGDYEIVIQYTGLRPWTARSTTNWEDGYNTGSPISPTAIDFDPYFSQFSTYYVNFHEFGHALRHTVDGDQRHLTDDASRWTYLRKHDYCGSNLVDIEAFAFNEGWAEYWEVFSPADIKIECPSINWTDMTKEGAVAADMFWIARVLDNCIPIPKGNAADSEKVRRKLMFAVINRGQNIMHSEGEFRSNFSQQYPGCALPLPGGISVVHFSSKGISYQLHDPTVSMVILRNRMKSLAEYSIVLQKEIIASRNGLRHMHEKNAASSDSCIAKVTRLAMLEGKYKYVQFLMQVFKKRFAFMNRKEIYSGNYQSIDKETKRNQEEYIKNIGQINRNTWKECISSLKKYFPSEKSIKEKIAYFERRIKMMDLNTPKNHDAYLLEELPESISADKVSRMEKRKSGNY